MTFLNPGFLWFLLALPVLAALYLLRVRPERKVCTALFLWENIFQEKASSALLKRLRDLLSLLIMALIFICVILSMARPVFFSDKDSRNNLILIIDSSASMNSMAKGRTRLELAKEAAKQIINNAGDERSVTLATIADKLNIIVASTNNPRHLYRGLESIKNSQAPLNHHALAVLDGNPDLFKNKRSILVTDACFQGVKNLGELELLKIGEAEENIGITSFDLAAIPGKKGEIAIYWKLFSSFKQEIPVDIILSRDSEENIVKVYPVKVKPGLNPPEIDLFTTTKRFGKWILSFKIKDALLIDNSAFAVLKRIQPIRIEIDPGGPGANFFQLCVVAFEQADGSLVFDDKGPEIQISLGHPRNSQGTSGLDRAKKHIIFKPKGKSKFWFSSGKELAPGVTRIKFENHPVSKFCDLETLVFEGQKDLKPPKNAVIIAENENGTPLVYKCEADGESAYVINMDPEKADFFLSARFPVLVYSMAKDLCRDEDLIRKSHRPGERISLKKSKNAEKTEIISPSGKNIEAIVKNRFALDEIGFYKLKQGDKIENIACSLLDKDESDLDNVEIKSSARGVDKRHSASNFLLLAALLMACGECLLYHRRKVG